MAFATMAGNAPSSVAHSGLIEATSGLPYSAAALNSALEDLQTPAKWGLLAGVLVTGVITGSGLNVAFPAGFTYFAGQVWKCGATTTINVPDTSVSYIWGCSDGQLRTSASAATVPAGFDSRSACLLCKATAAGGVATVDVTVQQKARSADSAARKVADGPLSLDYANNVIDLSGAALKIPSVTADPTVPSVGTFVWFRSDTLQLSVSVGGVVKRSAAFS